MKDSIQKRYFNAVLPLATLAPTLETAAEILFHWGSRPRPADKRQPQPKTPIHFSREGAKVAKENHDSSDFASSRLRVKQIVASLKDPDRLSAPLNEAKA